jgi:hypothetical protein
MTGSSAGPCTEVADGGLDVSVPALAARVSIPSPPFGRIGAAFVADVAAEKCRLDLIGNFVSAKPS